LKEKEHNGEVMRNSVTHALWHIVIMLW